LHSGETTYDLNLPLWPFYGLAWGGLVMSVPLLLVRLMRQFRQPAAMIATAPTITH